MTEETEEMTPREIITTPEFELGWPHLFKTHSFDPHSRGKYMAAAMFKQQDDLANIEFAIYKTGSKFFGEDTSYRNPLREGENYGDKYFPIDNHRILKLASTIRPIIKVLMPDGRIVLGTSDLIQAGDICTAEIVPYGYETRGHKGITFQFLSITKVKERDLSPAMAALLYKDEPFMEIVE